MKLKLSPSEQQAFTFTRFHQNKKEIEGNFPDFLIVGPQRTGTTWLTHNLRFHPEIFLSFPKELYFFNRLADPMSHRSLHYERFDWNLFFKSPKAFGREIAKVAYFDILKTGKYQANELEWYLKFFELTPQATKKERQLIQELYGEAYEPTLLGEATASYAALPLDIIREIVALNPDLKIILMVRDPVARAWSHAKKDLVRNAYTDFEKVPQQAFIDFFEEPYQIRCGSYTEQIQNWKSVLSEEKIFVGDYGRISYEPKRFILQIFEFLGVNPAEKYVNEKIDQVINKTGDTKIPSIYRDFLEEKFKEEKLRLAEQYGISFNQLT